jgi:hypothetical protein
MDSMATMNEWVAFFSGNYQGCIRSPDSEWEDLIGTVKLECAANKEGFLEVTITILEFGIWTGCLRLGDGVMEGSTGQGDTYFKCVFHERGQEVEIQGCFHGEIYEPPTKLLFELHLASDWRKRPPKL